MAKRIQVEVVEDCSDSLKAYVTKSLGAALTQADVTSITYTITDMSTGSAVSGHSNQSLSAASVIFDTLVTPSTDSAWTIDSTGYNFRHDLAGTAWPNSDRIYYYDCFITLTNGAVIPVLFEIAVISVARS